MVRLKQSEQSVGGLAIGSLCKNAGFGKNDQDLDGLTMVFRSCRA